MHKKSSEHIIRSLINECKQFLDFPTINMEPACVNRGKGGELLPISLKKCAIIFTQKERKWYVFNKNNGNYRVG